MMRFVLAVFVILIGLGAVGLYMSAFIVRQTNQAIQLRFGEPKAVINEPGLNWRIPLIDEVAYFDKRILDLDLEPKAVYSAGQKQVIVDAFARFRITDPLEFYKTVRTEIRARARLGTFLEAGLRRVLGAATLEDLVRDKREELMAEISRIVNEQGKELGVVVIDVRIKRADLPEANSAAIYRRMETERQREAAAFRAEGAAEANRIRATADREATIIRAEAEKKSQQMRGEADAERNRIFAEAFGKDPQFFAFYRSMQAYEKGLTSGDTRLVISPNSEFFRYFGNISGQPPAANGSRQPNSN
ncbi:MAG: protease modulator HflC [Pseudomonadota bacterium]